MENRIEAIRNFLRLSDRLGTAGQPAAEQFAAIRQAGYRLVINLAQPDSPNAVADERELVRALGLDYVHIPVAWTVPQIADAARFFETMNANQDKKVFVHCAANKRVASFLYLYRRLFEGLPEADAARDLHRLWVPDEIWQGFMEAVMQAYEEDSAEPGKTNLTR